MASEAHCMSSPCTELLLFNYAKVKTVFHSMALLNGWLAVTRAVRSTLQKPSTFPSSTCIALLRGDFMNVICAAAVFIMLIAACCGYIGSRKSWYLLCRSSSSTLVDLFHQDRTH